MADPVHEAKTVRFGPFELDLSTCCLMRGGQQERLALQPSRLLVLLVQRRGELVTREELRSQLWPGDSFGDFDHGLNNAVNRLREALRDSATSPRYIQTAPRRGYRFIAAVELLRLPEPLASHGPTFTVMHESTVDTLPAGETDRSHSQSNGSEALQQEESLSVWMGLTPGSHSRVLSRRKFIWAAGVATMAAGGLWLRNALRRKPRGGAVNVSVPMPQGVGADDPGRVLGPPVVAPDGSALVVSLRTSTANQLYIRPLNANQLIPIERTQDGSQPFWSPDSQHIAFFAEGKLKRVPAAGGSVMVLCEAQRPRGGSWGSRGTIIFGLNTHAIFQVAESGGPVKAVNQLDTAWGENSHRFPVFLPDGDRFLYLARNDNPDRQGIYLESIDHSVQRKKILVAEGEFALGHDPDTQEHFLLSQQVGKIVAQRFDIRRGTLYGQPHRLVNRGGMLSASNTGVLVMRTEQLPSGLVWRDRNGTKIGVLGGATEFWAVALSPNGQFVAASKHDPINGQFTVWVASLTDGLFELVSDADHATSVMWSWDSNTIYYADIREWKLFRRTLNPRGVEEVVCELPRDAGVLDVSPDGRYAAGELAMLSAHTETAWIDLRSVDRGNPKSDAWHRLGSSDPHGPLPRFSPDGKWLAFNSTQGGTAEVYVMDFPACLQRHRVSTDGGRDPRWRNDCKELFYVSDDGSLMAVPVSTQGELQLGNPDRLFAANLRRGGEGALYDVSPNGQRFLLIAAGDDSGDSGIEMILNWPSLLL